MTLVPTISYIIIHYGWEMASYFSGFIFLIILLPLCIWFRNRPEDMGLRPDGDTRPQTAAVPSGGTGGAVRRLEVRDYTVREALRTSAYWLLMVGAGLRQVATLGILVSIVPILELKGMGRQEAANLTGLMFGINFFSRLILGYMGDRWSKSLILAGTLAIEALGFFALYYGDWSTALGVTLVLTFIVLQGMGDGAGIIVWAAVGEYYGRNGSPACGATSPSPTAGRWSSRRSTPDGSSITLETMIWQLSPAASARPSPRSVSW